MEIRDVIKDEIGEKLPSRRPFRPDVRARPRLPRGRGFTHGRVFTVRGRGKNRVRGRENKNKNKKLFYFIYLFLKFFFGSFWKERGFFQFSIFGFRLSIPKIPKLPKLPELRGLRERSREKKKVFSA
jgi:hypothetical protein